MSKKRFIQDIVIRSLPAHGKLTDCVRYAENLYDGLTQLGYGAAGKRKPRESHNYYADLNDQQRRQFNAFWNAFAYKKGRNEAALRWLQLVENGELTDELVKWIIHAAGKEAQRQLPPGQARKEAQGWLFGRRWEDHPEPEPKARQQNTLAKLQAELEHVKRLHAQAPNKGLLTQIHKLEKAIEDAKHAQSV